MLAKTTPITRLAVHFDRGRAALAAVFEVVRSSPPSVTRQAYVVARELNGKAWPASALVGQERMKVSRSAGGGSAPRK
jgi:hypothetical protein